MSIPSPPRLSCDSKKCLSGTRGKYGLQNKDTSSMISYEIRGPKDLPGIAKEIINVDSFFPYDESLSSSPSHKINTSKDDLSAEIESSRYTSVIPKNNDENISNATIKTSSENLSEDEIIEDRSERNLSRSSLLPRSKIPQQIASPQEELLIQNKFLPIATFILERRDSGKIQYLVQFSSFYGDKFFVSYKDRTIMGDEKIILYEANGDKIPLIISSEMSERLEKDMNVITLYESSVFYQGKTFSQSSSLSIDKYETHNPSTYPVIDEKYIEDPLELAMKAHKESLLVDSIYRHELKSSYNSVQDEIIELSRMMEEHHDVFKEVDALTIEESDNYYDDFLRRYVSDNPIPPDKSINRMRFLNEASNRYVQVHFIFWDRLRERIRLAKKEFEATISNIYLQMSKDYPEIEGIPIDPNIDISRSYPGRIFPNDL
jgi:hypothetical protein